MKRLSWIRVSAAIVAGAIVFPLSSADAGIPCLPTDRSIVEVSGGNTCQYRFASNGTLDEMLVVVTLLDCFEVPIGNCAVSATVTGAPGTAAFCSCEPSVQIEESNAAGALEFRFSKLGGRGELRLSVTTLCVGSIGLYENDFDFTSRDLDGTCETLPQWSTSIIDLAIWVGGWTTYARESDYDCDGTVSVIDLGILAGGFGHACE